MRVPVQFKPAKPHIPPFSFRAISAVSFIRRLIFDT